MFDRILFIIIVSCAIEIHCNNTDGKLQSAQKAQYYGVDLIPIDNIGGTIYSRLSNYLYALSSAGSSQSQSALV